VSVVYIAFPVTLLLAAGFVAAFVWAARKGQFDDVETPAVRMLFDDDEPGERASQDRGSHDDEKPDGA